MSYSRLHQNFNEPRGHSSAVASVLYSRGAGNHQVTKSGSYIYSGDASNYHEWEFRTRLRVKASGDDPGRYAEAMSKVVDGLRGDAFIVAKEVGLDSIWYPGDADDSQSGGGVDTLIGAIKLSVFPMTTHEEYKQEGYGGVTTGLRIKICDLDHKMALRFYVTALNDVGCSEPSEFSDVVVLPSPRIED